MIWGMEKEPPIDRDTRMEKLARSADLYLRDIDSKLGVMLSLLITSAIGGAIIAVFMLIRFLSS